jgi:GxxExxY protein
VVEEIAIPGLKSVRHIVIECKSQLVNYLTSTHIDVGLILNFREKKVELKQKVRELPENLTGR